MVADPFATELGACSVSELGEKLAEHRYYADEGLLTAIHLALVLGRPLALEGEPGVGKTQVAKVLAEVLGRELIRLQCYEGLDASQALYEWDHAKQLLHVRVAEAEGRDVGDLYDERFLLERPLLRAVRAAPGAVLLIDEIDRSDSEFEAFLLEFLSDFQVTIPELGTLRAERPPIVVMTSNRTRELHDALKRRCLYHWIPFPDAERERRILRAHAPGLDEAAAAALVEAIKRVRTQRLIKRPGIAETIDWAQGAQTLAREGAPWPEALQRSLGLLLKEQEDVEHVAARPELLGAGAAHERRRWRASTCSASCARSARPGSRRRRPSGPTSCCRWPRRRRRTWTRSTGAPRSRWSPRRRTSRPSTRSSTRSFAAAGCCSKSRSGSSPEAEGETAAPKGGDEGELAAPWSRSEGSGLHASPLESVGTRRVRADLGRRARGPARDRRGGGDRAAGHDARGAPCARGAAAASTCSASCTKPTARAARCCASPGASARRARAACCLLIDVSGSQRAHSPDLLRFAHEVVRGTERAEAFTFGTRLTRVTRALDTPDVDRALEAPLGDRAGRRRRHAHRSRVCSSSWPTGASSR